MTTVNEANSIMENLDSFAVAKALFPEPITANDDIEVGKTRGKKSKNEPLANAYKNAIVQISNELHTCYKIDCTVRYGSDPWMSKTQRNHVIKLFCKKCVEKKMSMNLLPGKEDLVALVVCNDERKKEPSVTVKRVFFHDSHNTDTKDDASKHPRNGWETVKFPIDSIFGETYKKATEDIGRGKELPPRSKLGEEDGVSCELPDESKFPSISSEMHRQSMIRLMFFFASEYNIASEMAPFEAPNNLFMRTWLGDDVLKDLKNSEAHLSLAKVSLNYKTDNATVQQPLHRDFSHSNKKKEPKSMSEKFKPASFLIPLETSRFLHVQAHGNLVEVKKGEILFYSGDLLYADHTSPLTGKDVNIAIRGHVDSAVWKKFVGGGEMHWDHDLVKSNAKCLSERGSVGDIIQGMDANLQVATYLFAAAEEKLKDSGMKAGKKRTLDEVNARSEKVLRELKAVTESLKAITGELH